MGQGKKGAEQVLLRRLMILSRLPTRGAGGGGLSVRQLLSMLAQNGFACGVRTVERDLADMADPAKGWRGIGVELHCAAAPDGTNGNCWSHQPASKQRFLAAISPEQALMLQLVEQELRGLMPRSAYEQLGLHMDRAGQVLDYPSNAAYARFLERVEVLPDATARALPVVQLAHLAEINEALLQGEQLDVGYHSPHAGAPKQYRLHPVGLVRQGQLYWLLAVKDGDVGGADLLAVVQAYRPDRMLQVARRRHDMVARRLPSLRQALAAGRMEFFAKEPVALVLRFANNALGNMLCDSYREAPLGSGQRLEANEEGGIDLHTLVRPSLQLEWQLQRYADRVRVLQPEGLRQHLQRFALAAARFQQASPD